MGQQADLIPIDGSDQAALALLPFAVTNGDDQRPLSVSYQLLVDGKPRRMSITLASGHDLPTHADQMVFLGLLQLALQRDQPERVTFRRTELLNLLGRGSRGEDYDNLRQALERLTSVMITANTAFIARDGREYGGGQDGYHLIDDYHIGKGTNAECYVRWGRLVREGFRLGDFKRLDWGLMLALNNPLTAQLYRLLDRVTLSGETEWDVGWRTLATALGMTTSYDRPAKFKDKLQPHLDRLIQQEVVDRVEYLRGGTFVFYLRNYLRAQIRRVLGQMGVYHEAARQLVAGYDETHIMIYADCSQHGAVRPKEPAAWLVRAIQEDYALRYGDDEPEAFVGLWGFCGPEERREVHEAGLRLLGLQGTLYATHEDPTVWPQDLRSVCRFLVAHSLEPRLV